MENDDSAELACPSDKGACGVSALRRKMDLYQANGARLGLASPAPQADGGDLEGRLAGDGGTLVRPNLVGGSELAKGLALDLEEIWAV